MEYIELELRSVEHQGAHEARGRAQGVGHAPHPRGQVEAPLTLMLLPIFFIYSRNILHEVSGHSDNFYFCRKITPWHFC